MKEATKTLPRGVLAKTVRAHIAAAPEPVSARQIADALGLNGKVILALMRDWTKTQAVIRHGEPGRNKVAGGFTYSIGPHVPVALTYPKTPEERTARIRQKQRDWVARQAAAGKTRKRTARPKVDTERPAYAVATRPPKAVPAPVRVETVEQFRARGGRIEKLPGIKRSDVVPGRRPVATQLGRIFL
jgi:hypothetical protein